MKLRKNEIKNWTKQWKETYARQKKSHNSTQELDVFSLGKGGEGIYKQSFVTTELAKNGNQEYPWKLLR